jgi:hypothetical protein
VFEITFECNFREDIEASSLYEACTAECLNSCMCVHMNGCVYVHKRGSKPVVNLHDTSLVPCSVESLIMLSLDFI